MPNRRNFLRSAVAAPLLASTACAEPQAAAQAAMPRPGDPAYWDKLRGQFLLARDKVFFNNGTIGAMPRMVLDRTVEHLRKMAIDIADWDYRGPEWIAGYGPFEDIRGKTAKLLNCEIKEVALTENNTCAMSYVAGGLDLPQGAEILITDQEHPGGQSPWLNAAARRGGTVTKIAIPKPAHSPDEVFEIVKKSFTPRTHVLAISHVITGSGAILPVKEICAEARARGIYTVLDGAQAFGHIPVNLKEIGCDAYVGCFHKWLLAPAGNGFLYLRRDSANRVWTSIASSNWDNHQDNGYRLTQRGTGSLSILMGADAALDFHNAIGPERVYQRLKYLGDYLRDGLRGIPKVQMYTPADPKMNAAITVYGVEGYSGAQLQDEMWKRDRLRPRASGGIALRQCTHIYNSTAEIDRALKIVRDLAKA
jgi:selenocysteine lyase/cysteine desulfurase